MNNYDEVIEELEKEVNNIKRLSELISDVSELKEDISMQAKEFEESLNKINILSDKIKLDSEKTTNLIGENLKSIEVVLSDKTSEIQSETLKGNTYIKNSLSEFKLTLNEYEIKLKEQLSDLSNKIKIDNENNKGAIEANLKELSGEILNQTEILNKNLSLNNEFTLNKLEELKIVSENQKNKNKLIFIILFIIISLNVAMLFLLIK